MVKVETIRDDNEKRILKCQRIIGFGIRYGLPNWI